jgi:4-diphosphocytidyl-2-C-methyl-D-erythritol kinase
MLFTEICSIKLNLTLRILNKRDDGYHDISSLYWRLSSPETIEVLFDAPQDSLLVFGAGIAGENIVSRACRHIREVYGSEALAPVDIGLFKHLPAGSGVGAGSGNAAAFVKLFRRFGGYDGIVPGVASLGADVAFLASDYSLAMAGGIGEMLEGLDGELRLRTVIFFPEWSSDTKRAYSLLDETRSKTGCRIWLCDEDSTRSEAMSVLNSLRRGERVGVLPNDFISCAGHEAPFEAICGLSDDAGALAWGLCGSGSAYFALFRSQDAVVGISRVYEQIARKNDAAFKWLRQILVLE